MAPPAAVSFRAAFPDESGRAAYFDPDKTWAFSECRWFLALVAGPPERIVGCIRYSIKRPADGAEPETDFRFVAGPGGELTGHESAFLDAFLPLASGDLYLADLIPQDDWRESPLREAGFSILHRQQFFEISTESAARRMAGTARALRRRHAASRFAQVEIIPARDCPLEGVLSLVTGNGLMTEKKLRSAWNSPDPALMDRDVSACLVLGGVVLGVSICAAGTGKLRVKAIVGREDIPGARQLAIPLLMEHAARHCAERGYRHATFRAHLGTAPQTVNLALRLGGRLTGETRRWFRKSGLSVASPPIS